MRPLTPREQALLDEYYEHQARARWRRVGLSTYAPPAAPPVPARVATLEQQVADLERRVAALAPAVPTAPPAPARDEWADTWADDGEEVVL